MQREAGSVVYPLDTTFFEDDQLPELNRLLGKTDDDAFTGLDVELDDGPGDLALAYDSDGRAWLISTEGVGQEINATGARVGLRGRKENSITLFQNASTRISYHNIVQMAQEEPVDLRDWVRSFGSRLEDNFRTWRGRLGDNLEQREYFSTRV